ncbi:MAG: hypothetical protein LBH43_01750, partial [Treponema sp.]|jgi:hypothetical protein|nr:hypothetical protein [Treponema sp.]
VSSMRKLLVEPAINRRYGDGRPSPYHQEIDDFSVSGEFQRLSHTTHPPIGDIVVIVQNFAHKRLN